MAKVSVIIPTIKGREQLLNKLLASLPDDCEQIIVPDEGLSLAQKRNKGATQSTGEHLLFIDDDNYTDSFAIQTLIICLGIKGVGVVGMMACYHDNPTKIADGGSRRNYLTGFTQGINTNKDRYTIDCAPYEIDEVANAFMIKRELFMKLNGFDNRRFPTELDEADLCYRAHKLGYKTMICPMAVCYHQSITYSRIPDFRRPKNAYFMGRNRVLFQRKHLDVDWFDVYCMIFLPMFVLSYSLCLLYRRKLGMLYHFLKGVIDGLRNNLRNGKRY